MKEKKEIKPHYLGHRARLKEKFFNNPKSLADYELLEMVLFSAHARKDTKPLAKNLLAEFGSINGAINADFELLKKIPDANKGVANTLKIIQEFIRRTHKEKIINKPIIDNWEALLKYCQVQMEELRQEKFKVFFLDKKFQLLDELDQDGWVENVEIDIKTIIKKALNCSAKYLILTHNHPSGDIKPSKADILSTDKIIESLKVVEMKIYDHIIIGKNGGHYSFRESGLI